MGTTRTEQETAPTTVLKDSWCLSTLTDIRQQSSLNTTLLYQPLHRFPSRGAPHDAAFRSSATTTGCSVGGEAAAVQL